MPQLCSFFWDDLALLWHARCLKQSPRKVYLSLVDMVNSRALSLLPRSCLALFLPPSSLAVAVVVDFGGDCCCRRCCCSDGGVRYGVGGCCGVA